MKKSERAKVVERVEKLGYDWTANEVLLDGHWNKVVTLKKAAFNGSTDYWLNGMADLNTFVAQKAQGWL